jgi:hypothetical protein
MAARSEPGLVEAIAIDLRELHTIWMSLVFPRQREGSHSVLGKWKPGTTLGRAWYNVWGALGGLVLAVVYPLVVLGFATRFYTSRIDRAAASLGIVGVVLVSLIAWGALTAAAYFSQMTFGGIVAVAAAGAVATVSAVLAVLFARVGGRVTTVVLAYPFAMTAIFLPPVVAALYSPAVAEVIFPRSENLAIWLLDNVLDYGGIAEYIRDSFDLEGLAYVGMWFGIAVPLGWLLGILVTLADLVRPNRESETASASRT